MSRDLTRLAQELYVQNIQLNEQLQKAVHDYDREIEWNRDSQDRERARVDEVSRMRMRMVCPGPLISTSSV